MSKEIGRNDKCSCMSGKKYKNCCDKKKDFVEFFKNTLDSQYIDSNYIINSVITDQKNV